MFYCVIQIKLFSVCLKIVGDVLPYEVRDYSNLYLKYMFLIVRIVNESASNCYKLFKVVC